MGISFKCKYQNTKKLTHLLTQLSRLEHEIINFKVPGSSLGVSAKIYNIENLNEGVSYDFRRKLVKYESDSEDYLITGNKDFIPMPIY